MPSKPRRPCQHPGCSALAIEGASRCVRHHTIRLTQERDRLRAKSAQRSSSVRREVDARDQRVCQCCGKPGVAKHHRIPLSQGGADAAWNMVTLCADCHRIAHQAERRIEATR